MKKLFVLCLPVLFLFACNKKDDKNANVTPTVQNLAGTYTLSKLTVSSNGSAEQDITSTMLQSCERDDQWKLNTDMTFDYVDAGTTCSSNGSYSSDWSLTNSSTMVIDGETYTIKSFNGTALVLSETISGSTYTAYFNK